MNTYIYIKSFLALIFIYVILLFLSLSMPSYKLSEHVRGAQEILLRDGVYPHVNKDIPVTQLDNFTDLQVMVPRLLVNNSPLIHSMDMNGYARYWHGYTVFLRPLLSIFTIPQIRVIYGIAIAVLICSVFCVLSRTLNHGAAISFAIAMSMAHSEIFGQSMQFSNVFIITMLFMIFLSKKMEEIKYSFNKIPIYFFVVGSVVNFVDLLTVPIVSLSIPMIMVIYYINNANAVSAKNASLLVIKCSIAWAFGYGMTWIAKWVVATLILMRNVSSEAINQIFFRVMGDGDFPTNRIYTLLINFEGLFINRWVVLVIAFLFITAFLLYKRIKTSYTIPLFIVFSMPYVWYIALANHSQIHAFFTFRAQVGSMMV
ncbi:hypothetical protein HW718_002915, partial [Salmonella enterica subsp. enterica serovar Soerenga]|nr:hypothetical protein [Salmonella enterica subsp. enterica serovar Soerenga]